MQSRLSLRHSETSPNRGDRKPFNIASYALLTMMVAQVCDLKLGDFVDTLGDAHIYSNHFEQVSTQLARTPGPLPTMKINPEVTDLFTFRFEDFMLQGYEAQPSIAAANCCMSSHSVGRSAGGDACSSLDL